MFLEVRKTLDYLIDVLDIPGNDFIVYHNGEYIFRETRGYSDRVCTATLA